MSKKLCLLMSFVLVICLVGSASAGPVPSPWVDQTIGGDPGGSSDYDGNVPSLAVTGGGHDIWDDNDDFQFVYKEFSGDCELICRVASFPDGVNGWQKSCVMVRNDLTDGSVYVLQAITGTSGGGCAFQWRPTANSGAGLGNNENTTGTPVTEPEYIRLVRTGNVFNGYHSEDGINWVQTAGGGTVTLVMTDPVYIGFAVTSHDTPTFVTATFDNFGGDLVFYNPFASAPSPSNGGIDVSIDTNLTWSRGDGARWDKVYFGTDPCDANLTLVATIADFQAAEYDPGDPNLLPSTTYYWQIVEVNGVDEYPGPVWSFTTIPGEAQCQYPTDGTVIPGDPYPPTPSILYTELIFSPGPTAVKHTGYLSKVRDKVANRAQDANLNSPPLGGYSGYEYKYFAGHPVFYPYEGLIRGQVYYWTVDETDSFGNVYSGDVWEFAVQDYFAFVPSPPNEAIFVDTNPLLSWLEGYGSQSHDVFFGTSWEDVNNAYFSFGGSSPEYQGTTNIGVLEWQMNGLDPETKYYWRIDEVQGRFPPSVGTIYKGGVWEFTTGSATPGLTGEYFHLVPPFAGGGGLPGPIDPFQSKVLVRLDPNVNFDFSANPPPGVRPDDFSVRWTGQIAVPAKGETYTFTTETDDGARLWVNGQLVVDQWIDQGTTAASGDIQLDDLGPYDIEMEYYENGGGAVARLYWESSSTAYGIIPSNFLAPNLEAFTAYGPDPIDGALVLNWQPILSWGPAAFATTHNLYFSTDFDDVNERSVSPISLTDPCYHSPRLDLDRTYYWAVDGVNTLHGDSPWEGGVWSFTIPPGGTGSIIREWWLGITTTNIDNLKNNVAYPDFPTGREFVTIFEGPTDWANNYGTRLHGWLRPPTTGDYTFWLATDDDGELNLSTSEDPCDAVR
ncbi:MAG: PA14 domain-containing protein, partial [Planctomycetota bacterium]